MLRRFFHTTTVRAAAVSSLMTAVLLSVAFYLFLWQKADPDAVVQDKTVAYADQEAMIISAVKKSKPAVVSIVITKDVPKYETYYYERGPTQDFFGRALPDFYFQIPQLRQNGTETQKIGGGSGFLVTESGYIITNRHVVADPSADYTVFTNDGNSYRAAVAARDDVMDIAVLKIEGGSFPFLRLGDSASLEVGQSVIAIGNALGEFSNTVSSGIISGLSRSVVASDGNSYETLEAVIQTDAAINHGNSGGPLLDTQGRVVGVNVAVAEGSENIGFALPINPVKSIVESVRETGRIVRPYVGIRFVAITPEIQEARMLPVGYGAILEGDNQQPGIVPGSPADKAGLREGDIILEIDGRRITPEQSLALLIRENSVGDAVTLRVLSEGAYRDVRVVLEAAP